MTSQKTTGGVLFQPKIAGKWLALFWLLVLFFPGLFLRTFLLELIELDEAARKSSVKKQIFDEKRDYQSDLQIDRYLRENLNSLASSFVVSKHFSQDFLRFRRLVEKKLQTRVEAQIWVSLDGKTTQTFFHGAPVLSSKMAAKQSGSLRRYLYSLGINTILDPLLKSEKDAFFKPFFLRYGPFFDLVDGAINGIPLTIFDTVSGRDSFWYFWNEFPPGPGNPNAIRQVLLLRNSRLSPVNILKWAQSNSRSHGLQRVTFRNLTMVSPGIWEQRGHIFLADFLPRGILALLRGQGWKPASIPLLGIKASPSLYHHPWRANQALFDCGFFLVLLVTGFGFLQIARREGQIGISISSKIGLAIGTGIWLPLVGLMLMVFCTQRFDQWAREQDVLEEMQRTLEAYDRGFQSLASLTAFRLKRFQKDLEKEFPTTNDQIAQVFSRHFKGFARDVTFLQVFKADGTNQTFGNDKGSGLPLFNKLTQGLASEMFHALGSLDFYTKDPKKLNEIRNRMNLVESFSEEYMDRQMLSSILSEQGILFHMPFGEMPSRLTFFLVNAQFPESEPPWGFCTINIMLNKVIADYLGRFKLPDEFFPREFQGFRIQYGILPTHSVNRFTSRGRSGAWESWIPIALATDDNVHRLAQRTWDDRSDLSLNLMNTSLPSLAVTRRFRQTFLIAVGRATPLSGDTTPVSLIILGWLAGLGLLILLIARGTGVLMSQSLETCITAMRRASMGHLNWRLDLASGDEIENLAVSLNSLVAGTRERESMQRFVPDDVVAAVSRNSEDELRPGGERRLATILFTDIRSFTTLSENYPAEEIVEMLNDYFTRMEMCIRTQGGTIDKFIGDAIMAVFRDPTETSDQALRACMAALSMRQELDRFNLERQQQVKFTIQTGAGIASGEVILGRVGSARGRLAFTAVGEAVNIASQIEGASKRARKTNIVLAPSTIRLLHGQARVEFLDRLTPKGKTRPISLYELIELR